MSDSSNFKPDKTISALPVSTGPRELVMPYRISSSRASTNWHHFKTRGQIISVFSLVMGMVLGAGASAVVPPVLGPITGTLVSLMITFLFFLPLICCPSHLQVGANGLRLHWLSSIFGLISSPWIPWQSMDSVRLGQPRYEDGRLVYPPYMVFTLNMPVCHQPMANLFLSLFCLFLNVGLWTGRAPWFNKLHIRIASLVRDDDLVGFVESVKYFAGEKCDAFTQSWQIEADLPTLTRLWLVDFNRAYESQPRLKPGDLLLGGEYKVLQDLESGGQATVYKAERLTADGAVPVALKEFHLPCARGRDTKMRALKNIEHEANLLQSLSHPQIVRFVDAFAAGSRAYLVLEFIEGVSLRRHVQRSGPLNENECIVIATQICDVLTYLHEQQPPVIHRDLTPDNLLLKADGTVMLIDFNVAQRLESETAHTVVGKQSYMSPDQFRGEATTQSDIYSLGCILFWLATGLDPEPITPSCLLQANPQANRQLSGVIEKATALSPEERYGKAADIARDLNDLDDVKDITTVLSPAHKNR